MAAPTRWSIPSGAIATDQPGPGRRKPEARWRFDPLQNTACRVSPWPQNWRLMADGLRLPRPRPILRNRAASSTFCTHAAASIATRLPEAVDLHTKRKCALSGHQRHDLAAMGATLAAGGVNPLDAMRPWWTLQPAATRSRSWQRRAWMRPRARTGSAISACRARAASAGGIVAVSPWQGRVRKYFSPPLDPAGNSVRGVPSGALHSSERLGLDLFVSAPVD